MQVQAMITTTFIRGSFDMAGKKDNNLFAMVLAGVGALVAALIGVNELSKSRSKGSNGNGFSPSSPPPKSGGCGCSG